VTDSSENIPQELARRSGSHGAGLWLRGDGVVRVCSFFGVVTLEKG
jgi:hypothetical protein